MKALLKLSIPLLTACALARADAGVLIASGHDRPDSAIFSLAEMQIDVRIDNGDARVGIRQIFSNHTTAISEGTYVFALPVRAIVSDFAVWDDVTRIPGVILERRRAGDVYNDLKWQAIDPGLLQAGEGGADEARRATEFRARIVPLPPHGTKRLEIEYHERIPVENLMSHFAIPLRPDAYEAQQAGKLTITFELRSQHALKDFQIAGKLYPLQITERTAHLVRGSFSAANFKMDQDFAVEYTLDNSRTNTLEVIAYRNPAPPSPSIDSTERPTGAQPGFFQASALLAPAAAASAAPGRPKTAIALFDASLSMQWEKLDREFQALESLLHALKPADAFNVLLFNTHTTAFSPAPVAASPDAVEKALAFVRQSSLRCATNLEEALKAGLAQASQAQRESYLVLLSDGGATEGALQNGKLAGLYAAAWKKIPERQRPRTFVLGIGDDANMPLVKMLASNDGVWEEVRSTEPIEFKLGAFLSKLGRRPVEGLRLAADPKANFDFVYPLEESWFGGALASWVGEYRKPVRRAAFTGAGFDQGKPLRMGAMADLPEQNVEHADLPRTWAKARVDALLAKIERDGEDRASVDEIIRLARQYKFVTPYTSFLAAPRSLLRPRVIRPGDPVLRVKTDPDIVSVVALFPFGLIQELRFLKQEDIWQTRFLAPADMADGSYQVRLVLRDRDGHIYREAKTFVIASKPPVVRVNLTKARYRPGETVEMRVSASRTTRTVMARLYGAAPVHLYWNPGAETNTGRIVVPSFLPAGKYNLTVTAEDFAHNIGTQEVPLEVVP
ncbi:MAG: VIT and VWA domain-containing protein [Bryobacteraceae bacterium]